MPPTNETDQSAPPALTVESVQAMITAALAAQPMAPDVAAMIADALAKLPAAPALPDVSALIAEAIAAIPPAPAPDVRAQIEAILPTGPAFEKIVTAAVESQLKRAENPDGRPAMTATDIDSVKDWCRMEIHMANRGLDIDQRKAENP